MVNNLSLVYAEQYRILPLHIISFTTAQISFITAQIRYHCAFTAKNDV